jgi:hypothetical protein
MLLYPFLQCSKVRWAICNVQCAAVCNVQCAMCNLPSNGRDFHDGSMAPAAPESEHSRRRHRG